MPRTKKQPIKCFANCHMTPEEYGLWDICRQLSHKFDGKLIFDGRTIASYFSDTGKDPIYRIAKQLVVKGWFVCTKKRERGKDGLWDATEYQVLSHEEWTLKHKTKDCKAPVLESRLDSPFNQSRNHDTSSRGITTDPVVKSRHSIEYNPILNKKHIEELRTPSIKPFCIDENREAGDGLGKAENVPPVSESRLVHSVRSPEPNPVAPVQMDPPEPDEFEGMESAQIINLIPRDRGMQLYNRTKGHYSRDAAIAEVLKYREEIRQETI